MCCVPPHCMQVDHLLNTNPLIMKCRWRNNSHPRDNTMREELLLKASKTGRFGVHDTDTYGGLVHYNSVGGGLSDDTTQSICKHVCNITRRVLEIIVRDNQKSE